MFYLSFSPNFWSALSVITQYAPVAIGQNGAITALLAGFALFILAYGLWRHKRMAWLLTILVLGISVVSHLIKQNYTEVVLASLLIGYLIAQRSHFHALSDEPSVWQGVQVFAAAFGFTLLYGTIGFYVLAQISGAAFNLREAWLTTYRFFTIAEQPGLFELHVLFDYLAVSIYIVGAVTFGFALLMLLRPVLVRAPASEQERHRAKTIIEQYSRSALAQFMLLPGKSYFFSDGGSVVTFSLFQRSAIALGDPVGPPADLEAAIEAFLAYCRRRDWRCVFYRTQADLLTSYHEAGLQSIQIGQDVVIDLQTWAPPEQDDVPEWETAVHPPPQPRELIERLRLVSDAWLSEQHQEESRFAHGWFNRAYIQDDTLITLSIPDQDILGFIQILQTQVDDELAVSLCRYRDSLPPCCTQVSARNAGTVGTKPGLYPLKPGAATAGTPPSR